MKKYEINSSTLVISSISKKITEIIEVDNTFIVEKSVLNIIDESCKFFGSSYKGRLEATNSLIGSNYKNPILIEESRGIIFFPTCSSRLNGCMWISLNNIKEYKRDNENVIITFKNDKKIKLNISYNSLENQILKSALLDSKIRQNKSQI